MDPRSELTGVSHLSVKCAPIKLGHSRDVPAVDRNRSQLDKGPSHKRHLATW
jgi:hypothetical protein